MKPLAEQNLYELLEVPFDAPEADIVRAWERAEALYGPQSLATYTLISPDEAALLGRRLEEALSVLLDPAARKAYDARLSGTPAPRQERGEDGTAASAPGRLPPIIPPLSTPAIEGLSGLLAEQAQLPSGWALPLAAAACPLLPAHTASLTNGPLVRFAGVTEGTTPKNGLEVHRPPFADVAVALPDEGRKAEEGIAGAGEPPAEPRPRAGEEVGEGEGRAPAILLSVVACEAPPPIPLDTPVPVSPPFAAVTESVVPSPAPEPAATSAAIPSDKGIFIPEGTRYTGDVLRRAREARGLTLAQMSERTKIARRHLENLEADDHERLPALVYLRGILMAVAKELRLDGQKVARSYLQVDEAKGPAANR
ncbi:MAG TPA: helix-turn-helix domain-containing protein [Anaeromyxobacteraceae bacterium]|nr:helix-turn-helix domain-containing protein [Anaeromyxobacteraceae bacterium]